MLLIFFLGAAFAMAVLFLVQECSAPDFKSPKIEQGEHR
jgi:hypothetical protein